MTAQQADTSAIGTAEVQSAAETMHSGGRPTPREVLSRLPANATPEQQDSAIQQHFKPGKITWSTMPDTLHLPGHTKGKSLRDVSLPQYYKESFFSNDSLFHPELKGGRQGVAGDPVPYTVAGDNLITSLLIGCVLLSMLTFARSGRFIATQAKNFFFRSKLGPTTIIETSGEVRFQLFFVLQTCLFFAIGYFFYIRTFVSDTFIIEQYQIIGIFTAILAAYFLVKAIAYALTGWVFFDKKKNEQWMKSYLFLVSLEGLALFPMIMLQAYFGWSMQNSVVYTICLLVLFKLLTFYKSYIIFFLRMGAFLQIILYFCALEIIPLFALKGILTTIGNYLKINF